MIICLTGQPLSGKSTIGKRLAKELGYIYFSSGDYARELGKYVGIQIDFIILKLDFSLMREY